MSVQCYDTGMSRVICQMSVQCHDTGMSKSKALLVFFFLCVFVLGQFKEEMVSGKVLSVS